MKPFLLLLSLALAGCSADQPLNPSFPLTLEQAERALDEMEEMPVKLQRPVVMIGGYLDPGIGPAIVKGRIKAATGDERVITISTTFCLTFDACREHVIEAVEEAFPSDDPNWTVEVDVIGHSMGGLVGRYAAMDPAAFASPWEKAAKPAGEKPVGTPTKRLRIARLFTISTPHQGAQMAAIPFFDPRAIDMRFGSPLLQRLDAALPSATYELIPYVRLDDVVVGAANASPPGRQAWWVQNKPLENAHLNSFRDQRILADILRHLRGEAHYTIPPATPLP